MISSWVLLTMGDRPVELAAAVDSIRRADPEAEIIVVGNGAAPVELPAGTNGVFLTDNVGVPGGRNAGWRAVTSDLVCFLDDDARLADGFDVAELLRRFEGDPNLAIVSFGIVDPTSGQTARRHIPRIGGGGADRASAVTSFLGGACAIRASVLEEVGGYHSDLFYSHEETDLAWRVIDRGYSICYSPDLLVEHPADDPRTRHTDASHRSMRNRWIVAKRNLPLPICFIYLSVWSAITLLRVRSARELIAVGRGWLGGLRTGVERQPMKWSTVWRLSMLGRPPVI